MDFSKTCECINCGKPMVIGGSQFSPEAVTTWRFCDCGMKALFYACEEDREMTAQFRPKDKNELS